MIAEVCLTMAAATRVVAAPPALAAESSLVVLAASSLTESLQAVGAAWSAHGHAAVTFSFDASSRAAKQVEAGAPADAFFSADVEWMDYLDTKGMIDHSTRANLLGNTLVAIVPASSPTAAAITNASELATSAIAHLALAGESVPAGKYARAALSYLGAWDALSARVVSGDNVRTVLRWVATGEAEAGVVYLTDAKVEPRVKVAFALPPASYPAIAYPAAVVKGAAHAQEAASFLTFCHGPEATAIFYAAGFTPAP